MKSVSAYLSFALKTLWALSALLLVLFALSLSIIRYSLPHFNKHANHIENWVRDYYQLEVSIGSIGASWEGFGPSLIIKDIQLIEEDSVVELSIDETRINIEFWSSLAAWQFQSRRFELLGLKVEYEMGDAQMPQQGGSALDVLERLFMEQLKQFSLRQSTFTLKKGNEEQRFVIEELSWLNHNNRHQGAGELRIDEIADNTVYFVLDLHGEKNHLAGQLYAEGNALDLSPWINRLVSTRLPLATSSANFNLMIEVENSQPKALEWIFEDSIIVWQEEQESVELALKSGRILGNVADNGWLFEAQDMLLMVNQSSLLTNWQGKWLSSSKDSPSSIHFALQESIDLSPLRELGQVFLTRSSWQQWQAMEMAAELTSLRGLIEADAFYLQSELNRLQWSQVEHVPGIADVSLELNMHNNRMRWDISSVASTVQIDNLFSKNIDYRQFTAEAWLWKHGEGWKFHAPAMRLIADDLPLETQLYYDFSTETLTAEASLENINMEQVKDLLPQGLLGPDTNAYLNRALVSGRLSETALIWHGRLGDFPFAQNQGVFQAQLALEDATFAFDKGWPSLTNLHGSLLFENDSLHIHSSRASLMGVQAFNAVAEVPKLHSDSHVAVKVKGKADGKAVTELMSKGSLADSLGKILTNELQVTGDLTADLQLHIPFKRGKGFIVKGHVPLKDNQIKIRAIGAHLSGIDADLFFENETIQVPEMSATLLQQPISLRIDGDQSDTGYQVDIDVAGDWSIEPLLERFHPNLLPYLAGNGNWIADIALSLPKQDYYFSADIRSNLFDLDSSLPFPLAKQANQNLSAHLNIQGNKRGSKVAFKLGDEVTFNGILPHDRMQFSRAHLSIGEQDLVSMGMGFSVAANIAQMDFIDWMQAIDALISIPKTDSKPLLETPKRIYVTTPELMLAGQKITDVNAVVKQNDLAWLVTLNADQMKGDVIFNQNWREQGLVIKADYLHLDSPHFKSRNQFETLRLQELPPIKFDCKQCTLFQHDIGTLEFALNRSESGMKISYLRAKNKNGKLEANGDWLFDGGLSRSQVEGTFSSSDIGNFLKDFGVNSGIKDSKAKVNFNLTWQRPPYEFDLDTLGGQMTLRLTDGYITEIPDGGSRIFSLFSLESLVRKLRLDFRDVFAKGFFYDKIRGDFALTDGKMFTDNFIVDGGAGEMTMSGYTFLPEQTLNYQVGFTPNTTSSLPAIVAYLVNPATAIAALVLDEMLTSAKVIYHAEYAITGTWKAPEVIDLGKDSRDISLPAKAPRPESHSPSSTIPSDLTQPIAEQLEADSNG